MTFGDTRLPLRFWGQVTTDPDGECWLWSGYLKPNGYGMIGLGKSRFYVHRYAYESLVAPIPPGLQIDHLCRVRCCVNPAHLEAVSNQENVRRGLRPRQIAVENAERGVKRTHCRHGHEFTPENTRLSVEGWKHCRTCQRAQQMALYHKRRAA